VVSKESFLKRVTKTSGCWFWLGELNGCGYGRVYMGKRRIAAHRIAYELWVAPIPEGLTIDHLCRVRHCVNPDHLEPVTQKVNTLRGEAPSAINARKTHCQKGHEFTPENTRRLPDGRRVCRTCRRAYKAKRRALGLVP